MRAYVHQGTELAVKDINEPTVGDHDVKVMLKVAGLNHRDLNIPKRRGDQPEPLVLGSDGAGVVTDVGKNVTSVTVGDEVLINPGVGWKEKSDAPPVGFEIVGMPDHGTFAEYYVCKEDGVLPKPGHLTWEEAGVLSLAGLTGYRALFTKAQLKEGDTVFIPGAGSGVVTLMIQFAKAIGAKVIVTSRSKVKLEKARNLGADITLDTNGNWNEELKGQTIDVVVESVGKATFNRSLDVLKKGGRIVTFGATTEDEVTINIRNFFYGQYQLFGTTMGSHKELSEMLAFTETHQIHPVVSQVFTLDETDKAFAYLSDASQFGKIGLRIS
ncbi:zinc-binding dehydrogenase [Radiobacillus kanasensis]|uniref:zinc-binding dehydrogenase n=1 Tax=Radiobacillus kanasensis TaxID=2844358 RepID=UPI001E612D53|nr:zinc-binding dehydrogenase [Radiobacillus kanasensis]UFU00846.1 zinc-binding dehydrogenase [Radiobacillus kanasensis]